METESPARPVLLLSQRDAAHALNLSERTLFTLRAQGKLRAVRIGKAVKYDLEELRAFVARAKEGQAK
jgi:excisionase family DNA binding protein